MTTTRHRIILLLPSSPLPRGNRDSAVQNLPLRRCRPSYSGLDAPHRTDDFTVWRWPIREELELRLSLNSSVSYSHRGEGGELYGRLRIRAEDGFLAESRLANLRKSCRGYLGKDLNSDGTPFAYRVSHYRIGTWG